MLRIIAIWVLLFNCANATIYNTAIVDSNGEYTYIGKIEHHKSHRVKVDADSCQVVFTLGKDSKDLLCTTMMLAKDTLVLDDNTITFDAELFVE